MSNYDQIKLKIKQERIKCMKDPIYFFAKYVNIQHPVRGAIKFKLYPFQEDVLKDFHKHDYNIVLKSRQMGLSTLTAGYVLWNMLFKENTKALVIATKQTTAANLVTIVKFMYNSLPKWMQTHEAVNDNALSLKLKNGSFIKATSAAPDSGRSEALSFLILDEAAFINNIDTIWASAQQTIATGGKAMVISCVTKDTHVFTSKGLQTVSEFINDDVSRGGYEVEEYKVLGKDKLRTGGIFYNNGYGKTLKIQTKYSELEGSPKHKLFAYDGQEFGWKKLEELTTDDYVSLQHSMQIYGNDDDITDFEYHISDKESNYKTHENITQELSYLFGLWLAEGSYYKQNGDIKGIDITIGDDITDNILEAGFRCTTYDNLRYRISSKYIAELFKYLGFTGNEKSHDKKIPNRLLKLSRKNTINMLKGLFDGDGCAYKTIDGRLMINYTSISETLIDQIRMLLLNEGIFSCKYKKSKENINRYESIKANFKHDPYVLEINGRNAVKFSNTIGFNLQRKKDICESIDLNRYKQDKSHLVIPDTLELIKTLHVRSKLGLNEFGRSVGYSMSNILNNKTKYKADNISIDKVLSIYKIYKHLLNDSEREYWDRIINDNQIWVKIKSIDIGENYTYDFSLPDDETDYFAHSVIYNGIIGHQTPNGQGNWYHKQWVEAESGLGVDFKFNNIRLDWWLHPERDEEWLERQKRIIKDPRIVAQEILCSFLSSGATVISPELIQFTRENYVTPPIQKMGIDNNTWIWEHPTHGGSYMISADVARGDSKDYSAFHIFDLDDMRQVAEYKGFMDPKEYGKWLTIMGNYYNDALVVVENNNIGYATAQAIIDIGYKNLFWSYKNPEYVDEQVHLLQNYDTQDRSKMTPGFTTTSKTRPLIIEKLQEYFRENSIIIKSERSCAEMDTFIWNGSRAEAQEGYNDDLIMSMGIGCWIRDTALRLRSQGMDLTRKSLSQYGKVIYNASDTREDVFKHDIGNGQSIDLRDFLR